MVYIPVLSLINVVRIIGSLHSYLKFSAKSINSSKENIKVSFIMVMMFPGLIVVGYYLWLIHGFFVLSIPSTIKSIFEIEPK